MQHLLGRPSNLQRFLCLLIVAVLAGACAVAPAARVEAPAANAPIEGSAEISGAPATSSVAEEPLPPEPAALLGRLDNGLRYLIRANGRPENRAELRLVVNAGSILEDEDQRGLAHFLEHMAFNGTKSFHKQELVDYLEGLGLRFGPDLNAYTSFDETVYMLTVPMDDAKVVETAFQILGEWAQGLSLEGEEIDKERGVVVEEWRLGRGAQARVSDRQLPVLFHGSRYAERLPIGDKEILERGSHDALRRFYRDWYRPDLMAVVAVGDFETAAVEKLIRRYFAPLENPAAPRPRQTYSLAEHSATLVSAVTDPELTTTSVSVYRKRQRGPEGSKAAYRSSLVESLAHSLLSERLDEVARRPDPPFLFARAAAGNLIRPVANRGLTAVVREGRVPEGLEALLLEARRAEVHGFVAAELERASRELLRRYEQAYEERDKDDSARYADEYVRHFLEGESMPGIAAELELVREFLPSISLEEINAEVSGWSRPENRVVLVSGPEKEGLELPDDEALLAALESASRREVAPWVESTVEGPLMAHLPKAGRVISEEVVKEIGVTEWGLSNGVRVVLKPTDFQNDEVLIIGYSPGGHSLVEDDESFWSASFASSLMTEGGLGPFDRTSLRRALAGKLVSFSATIGELEEGLAGRASPQDLETLFQLLHLKVTAPRVDPEAFEVYRTKLRVLVENRLSSPQAVFLDRLGEVLSGDHPRRRPLDLAVVDRLDLEKAHAVYRDRFADAGDFTFLLVGSFQPEEVQPLVETYLASLPSTGRKETWRDVGVQRPEGVQTFEVRKGLEPQSQVVLSFGGGAPFSREGDHEIRTLADVLEIRLREVLREDKGGTYGVSVSASLADQPRENYSFSVSFGCAPESVEPLTAAVLEEIRALQKKGLGPEYLAKVQESQLRSRETNLRENAFWLRALRFFYERDWDPRQVLVFEPMVLAVTPEKLQELARRYLTLDEYVRGALLPEAQAAVEGGGAP